MALFTRQDNADELPEQGLCLSYLSIFSKHFVVLAHKCWKNEWIDKQNKNKQTKNYYYGGNLAAYFRVREVRREKHLTLKKSEDKW